MPYGLKYQFSFTNADNILYRIDIRDKFLDADDVTVIDKAAQTNSIIEWQGADEDINEPIQAMEGTLNFISNSISLETFYSEDDEQWQVEIYQAGALIAKGFLISEGSSELWQDAVHEVSIKFNDGLGLLKNVPFNEAVLNSANARTFVGTYTSSFISLQEGPNKLWIHNQTTDHGILSGQVVEFKGMFYTIKSVSLSGSNLFLYLLDSYDIIPDAMATDAVFSIYSLDDGLEYSKMLIQDIINYCIEQTGIVLPLRVFCNIYEARQNPTTDTTLMHTRVYTGMFADENGKFTDCYDVLEQVLRSFGLIIRQTDGYWNVYRPAEYMYFANQIPGYIYDETATPSTLPPAVLFGRQQIVFPVTEDALRSIQRPVKTYLGTFNYQQPAQLLKDSNLTELGAFISTSTTGVLRYDRYEMPDYFYHDRGSSATPPGVHIDGSYIEVVTDTSTNTEVTRYIVTPAIADNDEYKWLSFAPIEVSKGDTFNFRWEYRARTDTNDTLRTNWRFQLFYKTGPDPADTNTADLVPYAGTDTTFGKFNWDFNTAQFYYQSLGIPIDRQSDEDQSQWTSIDLAGLMPQDSAGMPGWKFPPFPYDGILVISFDGANGHTGGAFSHEDIFTRGMTFTIANRINDATNIIGQTHYRLQTPNIKNRVEYDITIDDSPRNPIAGTLFLDTVTDYGFVDHPHYFGRYMDKTVSWVQQTNATPLEAKRLGELLEFDLIHEHIVRRKVIEGTFLGIINTNMLSSFQTPVYPGSTWLISRSSFDLQAGTVNMKLIELYADSDAPQSSYNFNYLYENSDK